LLAVLAHLAGQLVAATGRQLWGPDWREEEAISLQKEEEEEREKEEEGKKGSDGKKKRKRIIDLLRR
jgi:hypothetical protein